MEVKLGIIGFGVIGTGVVKILKENSDLIEKRTGVKINLVKVADLDIKSDRGVEIDKNILTTDTDSVLTDPNIDVIVELIGGLEPARTIILKAFENKKHVVTANKAVIATHARELFMAAEKNGVNFSFEAGVGGCIPILKSLQESYASEKIDSVYGILNGTTNFMLTRMKEGLSYSEALKKAQEMGFAESDPSFDVEGKDAAQKLVILSTLIFNSEFKNQVYTEGIVGIENMDLEYAHEMGYDVKLLAIARYCKKQVTLRVHPALILGSHELASVNNELNAIYLVGRNIGTAMFYGKGAGQLPTATVVVGDIIDVAKKKGFESFKFNFSGNLSVKDMASVVTRYYLRMSVLDKPGVLAKITDVFGRNNISISRVWQKEENRDVVPLVMITHDALEKDLRTAISELDKLDVIKARTIIIRIEEIP